MKKALFSAALVAVSLTIANYGYQFFGDANWETALERSFFQWIAAGLTALSVSFRQKNGA